MKASKRKKGYLLVCILVTVGFLTIGGVFWNQIYKGKTNVTESNVQEDNMLSADYNNYKNNYYNQIKINGPWIYYSDGKSLNRYNIESDENQIIADGNYCLGDITDEDLFLLEVPMINTDDKDTSICCLDLASNELKDIYTVPNDESSGYGIPLIIESNILCCEYALGSEIKFHFFNKGDKPLEEIEYSYFDAPLNGYTPGAVASISNYGMYPNMNYSNQTLDVINRNGDILASIPMDYFDYMFTLKGFVYTDKELNIHLISSKANGLGEDVLLCSHSEDFLNYVTSDAFGIYGFIGSNDDENVEFARMDWNGNLSILASEKGNKQDVANANLSALGGIVAYLWNGELKIIK